MNKSPAETILRWGLAFTFFYAAIAGLLRPQDWVGYLPRFMTAYFPARFLLPAFSVYELILAALLFTGRKLKWAALFSILTLGGIVVFNIGALDITFRDVGLAMAALALYEMVRRERRDEAGD